MIKITHMTGSDEQEIALYIAKCLAERYRCYSEVKVYGDGPTHAPSFKVVNKQEMIGEKFEFVSRIS